LGIIGDGTNEDKERFVSIINNTLENPTRSKQLEGGRTAFLDEKTGTIVIRNPSKAPHGDPDEGTAFRPEAQGRDPVKVFNDLQ
jgi:hypothetical protein